MDAALHEPRPHSPHGLAGALASLALHGAVGAALVLAPGPAASTHGDLATPIFRIERLPGWVPIETPQAPDEPEGGRSAVQAPPRASAVAAVAPVRRGRGRGRASGDAQGSGPPTDAMVTLGEPDIRALEVGLPRSQIYRTLVGRAAEVRRCAPRGLDDFERVVVGFTVGPDGAVSDSRVERSTLGDAAAEACMTAAVRAWTFPAAENGGSTRVTYPFVVGPFDAQ